MKNHIMEKSLNNYTSKKCLPRQHKFFIVSRNRNLNKFLVYLA